MADTSNSGLRVVRELSAVARRGRPDMIVSDNVTVLTSNAELTLASAAKLDRH